MNLCPGNRWKWRTAAVCLLAGACLVIGQPQRLVGKLKGFSISPDFYPPPHSTQMKSFLQGTEAEPLPGGKVQVTNAKLKTFRQDGVSELLVTAPACIYETSAKRVSSAGPLNAQSSDGRFAMSGVGFTWEQTASRLFISNQVNTVVQLDALREEGSAGAVKTNASRSGTPSILEVKANRFMYEAETGQGTYSEAVRVSGTNLAIAAAVLKFKLPMNERKLQTINAEKDVVLDYSGIRAEGQTADYDTGTGILNVGGNPSWSADTRQGRARELIIERTNKTFHANGDAWLKMAGQSLGDYGFLPSGLTNSDLSGATNQYLEVRSDNYEFHTNFAVFERQVRVEQFAGNQRQGAMTCARMEVFFSNTNSLDAIRAYDGVGLVQGENRFDAGEALYAGTNGILALSQSPTWRSGERNGQGDQINVDTARQEMLVRGNAEMRFPANEMGDTSMMMGARLPGGKPEAKAAPGQPEPDKMARITADQYSLSRQAAAFQGNVRVNHPQMELECGRLKVELPPQGGKVESIVAEEAVRFNVADNKGQRLRGRANKAVYSYAVTPAGTNDLLELVGYPVLEDANGIVFRHDEILVLDIGKGKLITPPGTYRVTGQGPANDTNRLSFPRGK